MDPALTVIDRLGTGDAGVAIAKVAALYWKFRDYLRGVEIPVDDAQFSSEIAGLPGRYAPAYGGRLILAESGTVGLGCIAVCAIDLAGHAPGSACEIKRLFVADEARGTGLGRLLFRRILDEAVTLGYDFAVLDTTNRQRPAEALYRSEGFKDIPRYNGNPMPDAVFLGRSLRSTTSSDAPDVARGCK